MGWIHVVKGCPFCADELGEHWHSVTHHDGQNVLGVVVRFDDPGGPQVEAAIEPVPCQAVGEVCYASKHRLAREKPCKGCPNEPKITLLASKL